MNLEKYDKFKTKEPFYNGYELLSKLDRNQEKPEIYISTTNRSAGKTTFFAGYLIHRFCKFGEKFCLLFRYKYEIEKDNAINSFFPAVNELFFPELEMKSEIGLDTVFTNLYIKPKSEDTWIHCGYATSLSARDQIKKYSNMLNDTKRILFDEFQPESKKYLPNEVESLDSIHTSIARGGGSQCKYLPVILISNLVDINNPYYDALDVIKDMDISCKFYRGNGFVIEQGFNEASAFAHKESTFSRALKNSKYRKLNEEKQYLQTDYNMIVNIKNLSGVYLFTLKYKDNFYSCRYLEEIGIYYISDNPDKTHNLTLACTKQDISDSSIYDVNNRFVKLMKKKFFESSVRFSSFKSREAFLEFISTN